MSRGLHRGLLCLLLPLVLGLGGRGVQADEHRFETDYTLCPAHLRVQGPQELRAARGLKAGELRVSWAIPSHLAPGPGTPLDQAVLTVIADDGDRPVVEHRPPAETAVLLHPVPRGRDLEVAVAWTRRGHVISDIRRVRLRSTQTRTWEREERAPARTEVASAPALPPLPPVEGFAVDTVTDKSIAVTWEAPDPLPDGLDMFKIVGCRQANNDCTKSMEPLKGETSATLEGLDAHTVYKLHIRAVAMPQSGYRDSARSTETATTEKTQLPKVTNLNATEGGNADSEIDLGWGWNAPSRTGLQHFSVLVCSDADCNSVVKTITYSGTLNFTVIRDLNRNTPYRFRIQAIAIADSSYRDSAWSDIETAKTAQTRLPKAVLNTPTKPGTNPDTSVGLSWTLPSTYTDALKQEIKELVVKIDLKGTASEQTITDATATSHVLTGLSRNTQYSFNIRVVAKDESDYSQSAWSDIKWHTTDKTQLPKVAGVTAVSTSSLVDRSIEDTPDKKAVKVSWEKPSESDLSNIEEYDFRACSDANCDTVTRNSQGTSTDMATYDEDVVARLPLGTAYYFQIRALAKDGDYRDSEWSEIVKTRLAKVTGLTAATPSEDADTTMDLSWTAPIPLDGIASFKIERCSDSDCSTSTLQQTYSAIDPSKTEYEISGLTEDTTYHFRIQAVAATGYEDSAWSTAVSKKTAEESGS